MLVTKLGDIWCIIYYPVAICTISMLHLENGINPHTCHDNSIMTQSKRSYIDTTINHGNGSHIHFLHKNKSISCLYHIHFTLLLIIMIFYQLLFKYNITLYSYKVSKKSLTTIQNPTRIIKMTKYGYSFLRIQHETSALNI